MFLLFFMSSCGVKDMCWCLREIGGRLNVLMSKKIDFMGDICRTCHLYEVDFALETLEMCLEELRRLVAMKSLFSGHELIEVAEELHAHGKRYLYTELEKRSWCLTHSKIVSSSV